MKELETTPVTTNNKKITDPHEEKKNSPFFKPATHSILQAGKVNSEETVTNKDLKTKLSAGGFTDLNLDATFSVSDTPATTLQIIQAFWGTPTDAFGKDK